MVLSKRASTKGGTNMKAIVTNKNNSYKYIIENITVVNYVENTLIIVSVENNEVKTYTYSANEVIVAIA